MKSTFFTLGAIATTVLAQANIGNLPQCGQQCATNMFSNAKVAELGCEKGDIRCLCLNKNFIYGLRDCSLAICSKDEAQKVVEYGMDTCKNAGVEIATGSAGNPSITATATDDSMSSTSPEATPSGDSSLSTIYSTMTSDGSVMSTPISTVVAGAAGGAKSKISSVVEEISSKASKISSEIDSLSSEVDNTDTVTKTTGTADSASGTSASGEQSTETGDNSGDDDSAASGLIAGPAALFAAVAAAMLI